ncbi:MAG: tyrosine-protein phosphatase [Eubacterium sp.]|nr:tyrosine-protein phosphatase [Eubacterium sp.]
MRKSSWAANWYRYVIPVVVFICLVVVSIIYAGGNHTAPAKISLHHNKTISQNANYNPNVGLRVLRPVSTPEATPTAAPTVVPAIVPEADPVVTSRPATPEVIPLEGVFNARDLGGYETKNGRHVKKRKLLRSGELAYMTDHDVEILTEFYGLTRVIDLRYPKDVKNCPDRKMAGVKSINLRMRKGKSNIAHKAKRRRKALTKAIKKSSFRFKKAVTKRTSCQKKSYAVGIAFSRMARGAMKKCLNILLRADKDQATLIHCVYGKDRCGMMSAMVLLALGVKDTTICKDYAYSNRAAKQMGKKKKIVKKKYMQYVLRQIKKRYGSYEKYFIRGVGFSKQKLKLLRKMYLE